MTAPPAYYNENEPFAAEWLRRLIARGLIAPGDVDQRSIKDVSADDLKPYGQCHFFAGLGGWSYALRLAGWPDDLPVWTGSCPCQPFSAAGRGGGVDDERHLWPVWFPLIAARRPAIVFGEQVASPAGLGWFDLVSSDMEGAGYAVGAADMCAAGVGAPHIRQRLYFVGVRDGEPGAGARAASDAKRPGLEIVGEQQARRERTPLERGCSARELGGRDGGGSSPGRPTATPDGYGGSAVSDGGARGVSDAHEQRHDGSGARGARRPEPSHGCELGGLSDANDRQRDGIAGRERCEPHGSQAGRNESDRQLERDRSLDLGFARAPWADADWLSFRDGKWRPFEPGTFPLAHGVPGRVGLLRAYGNAIVPQVAAEFIRASAEAVAVAVGDWTPAEGQAASRGGGDVVSGTQLDLEEWIAGQ